MERRPGPARSHGGTGQVVLVGIYRLQPHKM
jgi:hypothetical protein